MLHSNTLHVISICWKSWLSTGECEMSRIIKFNLMTKRTFVRQMHSHKRYRCWVHLNDDLTPSFIPPLVLSNSWFWIATSLFNAQFTSFIISRLSIVDIKWTFEYHTAKTFTRTWAYELCRCIVWTIFVFERTFTTLFDNRIRCDKLSCKWKWREVSNWTWFSRHYVDDMICKLWIKFSIQNDMNT